MATILLIGRDDVLSFLRDRVMPLLDPAHEALLFSERDAIPAAILERAEILVALDARCDGALLERAPLLRAIVSPTIGIDHIALDDATARGIMVVNGAVRENAESMAEATVMLLLAAFYDLQRSMERLDQPQDQAPTARMLAGKTLGLLGYGAIARGVARRLAPWGVRLLAHSRTARRDEDGVSFVPLETLLRESDGLTVLASLNADSRHLLNAERLSWMKRGAILVNTSRGAIIDEAALADAIRSGAIGRAALDVFETEPLPRDSALRGLPHVLLTPHCVGHSIESYAAIPAKAAENVALLLAGKVPDSLCNPEILASGARRSS